MCIQTSIRVSKSVDPVMVGRSAVSTNVRRPIAPSADASPCSRLGDLDLNSPLHAPGASRNASSTASSVFPILAAGAIKTGIQTLSLSSARERPAPKISQTKLAEVSGLEIRLNRLKTLQMRNAISKHVWLDFLSEAQAVMPTSDAEIVHAVENFSRRAEDMAIGNAYDLPVDESPMFVVQDENEMEALRSTSQQSLSTGNRIVHLDPSAMMQEMQMETVLKARRDELQVAQAAVQSDYQETCEYIDRLCADHRCSAALRAALPFARQAFRMPAMIQRDMGTCVLGHILLLNGSFLLIEHGHLIAQKPR